MFPSPVEHVSNSVLPNALKYSDENTSGENVITALLQRLFSPRLTRPPPHPPPPTPPSLNELRVISTSQQVTKNQSTFPPENRKRKSFFFLSFHPPTPPLSGVVEVYRVTRRVELGIKATAVCSEKLQLLLKDISRVWNNLTGFMSLAKLAVRRRLNRRTRRNPRCINTLLDDKEAADEIMERY